MKAKAKYDTEVDVLIINWSEWGTIYWENGADLDPDILYSTVTGEPIPNYYQVEKIRK